MWQTLRIAPGADANFTASAAELIRSTARTVILASFGLYLAWYFVTIASRPFNADVWLLTLIVLPLFFLPLHLLPRRLAAGLAAWLVGLAAALTVAYFLFKIPEIALFYAFLPFAAVIALGWPAGLLAEAGVVAWVLLLARTPSLSFLPPNYVSVIILGGLIGGVLGWAAMHSLFTVVHWALFSFAQAQKNMDEARQHRAQMAQMLKDLDQAYYRLERANAALAAAWTAADEAEHFKTEFVTNVSHELRTPLNLIVGFSEVMLTAPESYDGVQLPGPYRSDLNAIYHSAQHLLALVDDVLDLARIEVGKISLAREEVDLASLVTDAASLVSDYITTKGLQLRVDLAPDLPALWIDRLRVRQVLLNLLVNAARFTERGWIRVSVARHDDEVRIRVSDTGRGIPAQDLPKVFEEFRTTEQPTSTWHSGTGLGLPISKKFVELHRGRMGVESAVGQGTTFWFTLPCVLASADPAPSSGGQSRPALPLGVLEGIIVVVHEDAHVTSLMQHFLSGYRLIGVASLEEGIALAEEVRAVALVAETGSAPASVPRNIPVITCPLPSGRRVARALGAADFLVKPVTTHDLLAALDRARGPVRRLLIADEDPELVRLFRRMVRSRLAAQDCVEAYNGEEALRLMAEARPDLVVLSFELAKANGRGVLEQMAAEPALAGIPVIVTSDQGADYLSGPLPSPIQVFKPEGFQLAEVVQILEATFTVLAPGWRQLGSRAPGLSRAPAGSPASPDTPRPPESAPAAVPSAPSR